MENSTHPMGLEPTITRLTSWINSFYVLDQQNNASHIYFYISGAPNQVIVYENDKKYELKMSDDGHFEFYDLGENGATNSLAYG